MWIFEKIMPRFSLHDDNANLLDSPSNLDLKEQIITDFLMDQSIREIWIDPQGGLTYKTTKNQLEIAQVKISPEVLLDYIYSLADSSRVRIDPYKPFAGGVIAGKPWRWHAAMAPLSPEGPRLALRRQSFEDIRLLDFKLKNFDGDTLWQYLSAGISVLIFGSTGSGKTTFLVSFLKEYLMGARVGVLETVFEIPMLSDFWFRFVEVFPDTGRRGGVSMFQASGELMRSSPDHIVLGEIRGEEAKQLPLLASSGHGGVLATIHGSEWEPVKNRLKTLGQFTLRELPQMVGIHVKNTGKSTFECELFNI